MSVRGEFQRILGELIGFLQRTGAPGSEPWLRGLDDASRCARTSLSAGAGAARTLLLSPPSAPGFASPLEIEEFARLQEHLLAICHAILGG